MKTIASALLLIAIPLYVWFATWAEWHVYTNDLAPMLHLPALGMWQVFLATMFVRVSMTHQEMKLDDKKTSEDETLTKAYKSLLSGVVRYSVLLFTAWLVTR